MKQKICLVAGLILLLGGRSAPAQEVCYGYDGLGRLIAAMDPQGQAAIYKYDAVGNILAINRDAASGPVDILLMDPPGGTPGTQVILFGIGFSPIPSDNQVTINGLGVNVLAASRCTLTVEIAAGATTGPVIVTTPSGSATAPGTLSIFDIGIPVTATAVVAGGSVQFTANITGCSDPRLVWSVNGIVGGNSFVGTITQSGLYTAPAVEPLTSLVTIRADSVGCAGLFAERTIFITGLPNVTVARPPVSVILPAVGTPGSLGANVTIAKPPVSVLLPGQGQAGGLQSNVTVANPPVTVKFGP